MNKVATWLQAESPAIGAAVSALLALLLGLRVIHVSVTTTGDVEAAVTAAIGLIVACATKPFYVGALTGFVGAVGTLAIAFHAHAVTPGIVSLVNAFIVAVLALVVRPQLSARRRPAVAAKPRERMTAP